MSSESTGLLKGVVGAGWFGAPVSKRDMRQYNTSTTRRGHILRLLMLAVVALLIVTTLHLVDILKPRPGQHHRIKVEHDAGAGISWLTADERERFRVGRLPWAPNVEPLPGSYSGLINVRQTDDYDANMFFWYFPAQTPAANGPTPLIIWLQGGPGSSSMIGLFYEMGPLRVGPDMLLHRNGDTWNTNCSMVFIDNPVGTGYSNVLAKEDAHIADEATGDRATPHFVKGYVNNQAAVGHDLVVFLKKFYAIFPEELSSPLYLSGESYAGKYVPHFATSVLNHNARLNADAEDSHLIPLRGVAIGNGLTDPSSQVLLHAPQALALGLVSKKQSEKMMEAAKSAVSLAGEGRWRDAASERERIFDLFKNFTGGINWYDVRKGDVPNDWSDMIKLLNLPATKEAVNVPQGAAFETDAGVRTHLAEDIMRSAKPEVERLLREGIKVMLYQGQFDFRDGILASTDWINSMEWKGKDSFLEADRRIWKVQGHVAGYLTSYGLLRRVELLLAGHLAPMDAGPSTRSMIFDFINDAR